MSSNICGPIADQKCVTLIWNLGPNRMYPFYSGATSHFKIHSTTTAILEHIITHVNKGLLSENIPKSR